MRGGDTGCRGPLAPIGGSPEPPRAASRNLSGSPSLLPLPALFQGGVCGVETRTRQEEELYNWEKPGRTSANGHKRLERRRGRCRERRDQ